MYIAGLSKSLLASRAAYSDLTRSSVNFCCLQVYYICGYLVSQLIVAEFRKAKTDKHKAFRVSWPYVHVLEYLKVYRRPDGTVPDANIPRIHSEWQKVCASL